MTSRGMILRRNSWIDWKLWSNRHLHFLTLPFQQRWWRQSISNSPIQWVFPFCMIHSRFVVFAEGSEHLVSSLSFTLSTDRSMLFFFSSAPRSNSLVWDGLNNWWLWCPDAIAWHFQLLRNRLHPVYSNIEGIQHWISNSTTSIIAFSRLWKQLFVTWTEFATIQSTISLRSSYSSSPMFSYDSSRFTDIRNSLLECS